MGKLGAPPALGVGVGVGLELLPLLHPASTNIAKNSSQTGRFIIAMTWLLGLAGPNKNDARSGAT
jgi:hypothetical protein